MSTEEPEGITTGQAHALVDAAKALGHDARQPIYQSPSLDLDQLREGGFTVWPHHLATLIPPPRGEPDRVSELLDELDRMGIGGDDVEMFVQARVDELRLLLGRATT